MKKYLSVLLLSITTLHFSCKKEYITQEITNIEDGTKILSGTNDPSLTTGKVGDFYINTLSKTLFGPKTESSWGAGVSLNGVNGIDGKNGENGTNGTNGINGNTILNGKGVPNVSLGKEGDFYLDTENLLFYGAKTTKGWGTPFSLKQTTTSNGIRVLLKENAKINEELSKFGDDENLTIRLNVGDISEYIKNGSIIIQTQFNDNGWTTSDNRIRQTFGNYHFLYYIGLDYGYTYSNNQIILKANLYCTDEENGMHITHDPIAISEAKKWFNTFNTQIKITLIPADKVEKLAAAFPNQKIDNNILIKHFNLNNW